MNLPSQSAHRPFSEMPRAGQWEVLVAMLTGRDRVDMGSSLQRMYDRYGAVVRRNLGLLPTVYLFGPEANRFVLLDKDRVFSARRPWMMIMGRIFPNGLLLMDGDQHKQHRKIMHEAFTRQALRAYLERMQPMIRDGLPKWAAYSPHGAFQAFKELTLDIAARIFVGEELGPETSHLNRIFEDLVAASMSKLRLPIRGFEFHRGLTGRRFMVDYFRTRIAARRATPSDDMFSRMCRAASEEGERFSDEEIIDHMIFLMMAAHDTTTSTLTSMTYELARHPDWQQRLREESRALGRDALELEDLERLQGLTFVMKETLRRYPPLPVMPRFTTAPVRFGGYEIPADAMVVVSPIHTHYMEEWWTEPQRFDPLRFAPPRAEDERHTHSWIPFGGGPHYCLGMRFADLQVKAIMHQILLGHRWSVPADYVMPVQQAPISKPLDGLPIQLSRHGAAR
jgi:cytochrome P450